MGNKFTLSAVNIVILARNYNPSIVSKEWLYEKGILEDTATSFMHTPPLSVIETDKISFILDENRLQLAMKNVTTGNIETLNKIAVGFVTLLPETPYHAIGFNYKYRVSSKNKISALFSPDFDKLKATFSEDCELGYIIAFSFKDFIVRMSVPPPKEDANQITVDLNFHSNCRGAEAIIKRLKTHLDSFRKAEEILRSVI